MPISGIRIPVKLPWKGATDNFEQFVSMKEPVAKWLGLDQAELKDLEYEQKVKKKGEGKGDVIVRRRRRPGYRQRAIRVSFGGKPVKKGDRTITIPNQKKVGGVSVSSVQFPITKSVSINDVIKFFESGSGKSLGVKKVTDANTGQSYPVN